MAGFGNLNRPAVRPDPVREAFGANGRLIASVFGSFNLYTDPVRLLNWAFANTKAACPN